MLRKFRLCQWSHCLSAPHILWYTLLCDAEAWTLATPFHLCQMAPLGSFNRGCYRENGRQGKATKDFFLWLAISWQQQLVPTCFFLKKLPPSEASVPAGQGSTKPGSSRPLLWAPEKPPAPRNTLSSRNQGGYPRSLHTLGSDNPNLLPSTFQPWMR